jgi:hypothetical protein
MDFCVIVAYSLSFFPRRFGFVADERNKKITRWQPKNITVTNKCENLNHYVNRILPCTLQNKTRLIIERWLETKRTLLILSTVGTWCYLNLNSTGFKLCTIPYESFFATQFACYLLVIINSAWRCRKAKPASQKTTQMK